MITITWLPSIATPAIASYNIQRAPDVGGFPGTFVIIANVLHDLSGPNYNPLTNRFFYEDTSGELTSWYSLQAVDVEGNSSDWSRAFQPIHDPVPPPFTNQVPLHADYPTADTLRYQTPHGDPIADAQIRVYRKVDFDLKLFTHVLGTTTTDSAANWRSPIPVDAGYTYTIHFLKVGSNGPDIKEVTVPGV